MPNQDPELTDRVMKFIASQKIFFVATATETSRINLSPKGMDSLRVLDRKRVIWLNVTGSGNETSAHVQICPRMTIMMCAFEGPPLILRIYGNARVIHRDHPEWPELFAHFVPIPGARQIFDLEIDMVQSSCGYAVPFFDYVEERNVLWNWAIKRGEEGLKAYWRERNEFTIDGIPTHMAEHIPDSFSTSSDGPPTPPAPKNGQSGNAKLHSQRGILRPAQMEDLPALQAAVASFPERLPLRLLADQGKLGDWLQRACQQAQPARLWSFDLYDGTRCVAQVGLTPRSEHHDLLLSFWRHPHYQGQGLAREAVACALREAFADPYLPRIWAGSATWNLEAHKLLLALGFVLEQENVDGYPVNGEIEKIHGFVLQRPAWAGKLLEPRPQK